MPLEQRDDGEREEGRNERRALLEDVTAVQDRADDGRVGGRAADLAVLELLHQARLGIAGRRAGGVLGRAEAQRGQRVAGGPHRKAALGVVAVAVLLRRAFPVSLEEALGVDDLASGAELGLLLAA